MKFVQFLLSIGIFLFPFQICAINVGTTIFDLFPIFLSLLNLITLTLVISSWGFTISKRIIVFLIICIFYIIIYLFIHPQPFYRFISALFWLSSLVSSFYFSKYYESDYLWRNFLFTSIIAAIYIYIQFFFQGIERPSSFFMEPSTAGLIMYSLAFYFFKNSLETRKININIFYFLFFLVAGIITKSSHIFVFIIFSFYIIFQNISNSKGKVFLFLLVLIFFIIYNFVDVDYYILKFNFSEDSKFNISQLSWLRGMDQAIYTIRASPFFGFGLGSTGYVNFYSVYSETLSLYSLENINLFDAYSLFLRFTIELGIVPTIFLTLYMFRPFKKVFNSHLFNELNMNLNLFNRYYIIGIFIFFGSLIKEPNYGVSPLFLSLLFIGIYINNNVIKKNVF